MSRIPKLRPYLYPHQIEYILMKLAEDISPLSKEIKLSLSKTMLNYDSGFAVGSYVPSPRETLESKLGLQSEQETKYLNGEMNEEEEAAYLSTLMNQTGI